MKSIHSFSALLVSAILVFSPLASGEPADMAQQKRQLIDEMVNEHNFDKHELEQLFDTVSFRQDIIDAMNRPAEAKPWYEYRPIFLTESRTEGGAEFWQQHAPLLEKAEIEYGVPAEIIVAIIGVETRYGGFTGKHRILDSLSTIAFGYPKRAKFFRNELKEFLLLAREEKIDPKTAKGSYAGAMGLPQFISSSYREYAVDYDGDGKRDLWNSTADIIGSVANYFLIHGWQAGEPVVALAKGASEKHQEFVDAGMKPSIPVNKLQTSGIDVDIDIPAQANATLIKLETGENQFQYWVGLNNFYAITRYNHSNLYAMAAYQLSQKIRERYESRNPGLAFQ